MPEAPRVTEISFRPASPDAIAKGMLGWAGFVVNEVIRIDGVSVRRTRRRQLELSYPVHEDRAGTRHLVVKPFGRQARAAIENQILAALPELWRRA